MSYLLDNSLVITKEQLKNDENKYVHYDKYELEDHYLLTQNEKAFFSIYDIAHYCKTKFPKDKLFLVAHRFTNNLTNENNTEFYIFNTIDIFEKSLTSLITMHDKELTEKQQSIQDNISLAKRLTKQDKIHLILGDNVKTHEILEYISYPKNNDEICFFDDYEINNDNIEKHNDKIKEVKLDQNLKSTRISDILKHVRIIEPKGKALKRTLFLLVLVVLSIVFSQDISDDLFYGSIKEVKNDTKKLQRELNKISKNYSFKENIYNKIETNYTNIKDRKIYIKDDG